MNINNIFKQINKNFRNNKIIFNKKTRSIEILKSIKKMKNIIKIYLIPKLIS